MSPNRLEAFSDGVIAIIITIMVLELKTPEGADWDSLRDLVPVFLSYVLSFVFVGIYWNNHHHLLKVVCKVNAGIMWANLHLLFWLSLIPFATIWMGENARKATPTVVYAVILMCAGFGYFVLTQVILRSEGKESAVAQAIGRDRKGISSLVLYGASIPLAFVSTVISDVLFVIVALIWLIPDRRLLTAVAHHEPHHR
jgi:uncharacterized membrane protein